jgi:hypothetical protein
VSAARDDDVGELADRQLAAAADAHHAVDLRRVGLAARDRDVRPSIGVDEHAELPADFLSREARALIACRALHEAREPLLLELFGHGARERVRGRALDRRVLEAADAVELRLAEPVEQFLELGVGLAGEADDEGAAHRQRPELAAPAADPLEGVRRAARGGACASARSGCACWNGMSR